MSSLGFYVTGIGTTILTFLGVITISLSILILTRIHTHFTLNLLGLSIFDFTFLVSSFVVYSFPIFVPDLLSEKLAEGIETWNDFSKFHNIHLCSGRGSFYLIHMNDCIVMLQTERLFWLSGQAGSIYFTILIATERCIVLYYPFQSLCMNLRQRTGSCLQWSAVVILAAAAQLLKLEYSSLSEEQLTTCDVNVTE